MKPTTQTAVTEEKEQDPVQKDYQEGLQLLQDKNYSQAAMYLHNALVGYERQEKEEGVANANDKLGDVCLAQQQYEKAMTYFEKAYAICKKHDDLMSLLALRKKLIFCYRGLQQHDQALQLYLELLDVYDSLNNPASTVEAMIGMAETYKEKGDLQNAADAYNTAADIHNHFKHERQAEKLRALARELKK